MADSLQRNTIDSDISGSDIIDEQSNSEQRSDNDTAHEVPHIVADPIQSNIIDTDSSLNDRIVERIRSVERNVSIIHDESPLMTQSQYQINLMSNLQAFSDRAVNGSNQGDHGSVGHGYNDNGLQSYNHLVNDYERLRNAPFNVINRTPEFLDSNRPNNISFTDLYANVIRRRRQRQQFI